MFPSPGQSRHARLKPNPKHPRQLSRFARGFARDEDGSLLIFGVYILVLMLMVGGIGIDLMRFERDRAKLQYTLDRAVLAAADLDQTLDPSAVVADYFDKAGLSDYLMSVTVDEGLGYRVVSADASAVVETQFMRMTGVDTLDAPAASTAEERIDGVEISLVLDVSGSMNWNNRLPNLKIAAKDFVDNMVDNTEDGKLSISIIPYATQVSTPQSFMDEFNTTNENVFSNCVNFQAADFNSTAIDLNQPLESTMYFDVWRTFDGRDDDPVRTIQYPICESDQNRELLVLQKDRNTLKTYIDNLTARGNTSIDIGMKWGSALLDPSLRPVVGTMIANGEVPADFVASPRNYDDNETLKVVVLMTDGRNTSQYYIDEDYRSGNSDVWWNEQEEEYSVYSPDDDLFYWPSQDVWADHPYGQDGWGCIADGGWDCENRTEPGDAVQLTYPQLWAYTSLKWNERYNFRPWMGRSAARNKWYKDVRRNVGTSAKNTRTQTICDAAKSQQIVVYTIGFEAPSSGQAVLANCASSVSHYFNVVGGAELGDAFSAIASSIRKLRLTQ